MIRTKLLSHVDIGPGCCIVRRKGGAEGDVCSRTVKKTTRENGVVVQQKAGYHQDRVVTVPWNWPRMNIVFKDTKSCVPDCVKRLVVSDT